MDWEKFKDNIFCIERSLEIQELEFVCNDKLEWDTPSMGLKAGDLVKVYQVLSATCPRKTTRLVYQEDINHPDYPRFFTKKNDAARSLLEVLITEREIAIYAMDAKIKMFEDMLR